MIFIRNKRRGRPKNKQLNKNLATPELRQKRKDFLTMEPLDYCLAKKIISKKQHKAGMILRCLHSKKFGRATVQAYNWCSNRGYSSNTIDTTIQERQYNDAIKILQQNQCFTIVTDICIYHISYNFINNFATENPLYELFDLGLKNLIKLFKL